MDQKYYKNAQFLNKMLTTTDLKPYRTNYNLCTNITNVNI